MDGNAGTIIIGAGQAGLAMSRCLRDRGLPHLVLERGQVAQRWRSERWHSFTLLSPNWQTRLPGHRYAGSEPDGFMRAAQVADMLQAYARGAPVRTGVSVDAVRPSAHGWWVLTSAGSYLASNVVVATGDLDVPAVPALAVDLPPQVHQLHTSRYRRPAQLPAGGVLVVGAGPSGQQIADELARAGRAVHIAVGRHKSLPRRYRGRDAYWWMDRMGMLDRTVDSLPPHRAGRRTPNAVLTGGREDLDLHRLVRHGVVPHGHLTGCRHGILSFAADLASLVDAAEQNAIRFRAAVDDYVRRTGLDVPARACAPRPPGTLGGPPRPHPGPRPRRHRHGRLGHRVPARLLLAARPGAGRRRRARAAPGSNPGRGAVLLGPALDAPPLVELPGRGGRGRRVPGRAHRRAHPRPGRRGGLSGHDPVEEPTWTD